MRRTVVYRALWLISEKDERARRVTFSPTRNLLAGTNETGKSRILKHLVWVLGCEPTARDAGSWDMGLIGCLELTIDGTPYTFMRRGLHQRAAFDAEGKLLIGTESSSAWAKFFSSTFDFPLKLQRHQEGSFALAGPEYALLPFYIDQEGGWGKKWTNFTRLTQFARWEPMVFESFTGLRPPRYFDAQLTRDEMTYQLREARAQLNVQAKSYAQVKAMLPASHAKLDETLFAQELKEMSDQVTELGRKEDEVRADLFDVAQQMQQRSAELQLVMRAEKELVDDLAYLAKIPDNEPLTCPTCGQEHGVTFRARLDLASDVSDAHQLVLKVREQLDALRGREAKLRVQLKDVTIQMEQLRSTMVRRKGNDSVSDIVAAKSLDTIELAYNKTRADLKFHIDQLTEDRDELQEELSNLTDENRVKQVRNYYRESLMSYAVRLDIDISEIKGIKIGARPKMGSGSSGPRIYLAMHMALLAVNDKYGNGVRFPFIIDTPRQQDLDYANTTKLLNTIFHETKSHQIFVANGEVPEGWVDSEELRILTFDSKRLVLNADEYKAGLEAVSPKFLAMEEAIRLEREAAAENSDLAESEEDDLAVPEDDNEDDDED